MKLSTLLMINAIMAMAFGLALTFAPDSLVSWLGFKLDPAGLLVAQLLGVADIGFAVLIWSIRSAQITNTLQAVILALFVRNALGFLISLRGMMHGIANGFGWLIVIMYILLAVGYGYFGFSKPNASVID